MFQTYPKARANMGVVFDLAVDQTSCQGQGVRVLTEADIQG